MALGAARASSRIRPELELYPKEVVRELVKGRYSKPILRDIRSQRPFDTDVTGGTVVLRPRPSLPLIEPLSFASGADLHERR